MFAKNIKEVNERRKICAIHWEEILKTRKEKKREEKNNKRVLIHLCLNAVYISN